MKNGVLIASLLAMLTGMAIAADGDLGVTTDVTWVSKYIFRGFDVLDDKAAIQPSLDFDLWGTGFTAKVWVSYPMSGGTTEGGNSRVNLEEWDYSLTYANSLMQGDQMQTDYAVSWIYYDYPDTDSTAADTQEFNLALAWPEICPFGVTPRYQLIYSWPAKSGPPYRDESGWIHVVGMDYSISVPGFLPENPEQVFTFSMDAVYNDGTYATWNSTRYSGVDHDWSHILWGLSTNIKCPYTGAKITPAIYYQTSMDDSVNEEDELWTGISVSMKF